MFSFHGGNMQISKDQEELEASWSDILFQVHKRTIGAHVLSQTLCRIKQCAYLSGSSEIILRL